MLYKLKVNGEEAKFLLEHMFERPHSGEANYFPTDFLTRGTWRTFIGGSLPTIGESLSDELSDRGNQDGDGLGRSGHSGGAEHAGQGLGAPRKHDGSRDTDDRSMKKPKTSEGGSKQDYKATLERFNRDANTLDLLDVVDGEFVDKKEKQEIIFKFLADHVIPRMTCDDGNDDSSREQGHHGLTEANLTHHNRLFSS
jgi:hypothetical protein